MISREEYISKKSIFKDIYNSFDIVAHSGTIKFI